MLTIIILLPSIWLKFACVGEARRNFEIISLTFIMMQQVCRVHRIIDRLKDSKRVNGSHFFLPSMRLKFACAGEKRNCKKLH